MNSFMHMIRYKCSCKESKKGEDKIYFHKTSLYNYLINNNYGKLSKNVKGNSNNVARYPKGKNFFSYDKHVLPVNVNGKHWTTCVIDMMNEIVYTLDSLYNKATDKKVCKTILEYVMWELDSIDTPTNAKEVWRIEHPSHIIKTAIPQQIGNSGDCGVFCIIFCEMLLSNQSIMKVQQNTIMSYHVRKNLTKLLLTFCTNYPVTIEDNSNFDNSNDKKKQTTIEEQPEENMFYETQYETLI